MSKQTIIEFPCQFPVKIVGPNNASFPVEIHQIIQKHFPSFSRESLRHKTSKEGNYLSFTATVLAENQEMLDNFYREISAHPEVKMVL